MISLHVGSHSWAQGNLAQEAPCPAPHYTGLSDHGTTLGHALLLVEQHGALGVSSVSLYHMNMINSQNGRPGMFQGWPDMTYHATCTLSAPEQGTRQSQSFLALIFGHLSRERDSLGCKSRQKLVREE